MEIRHQEAMKDLAERISRSRKEMEVNYAERNAGSSGVKNNLKSAIQNVSTTKAESDNSGIHLTLSKDALQELTEKSNAEYNKIVKDASAKSGAMSEDVMNRFKTNTINQAKTAALAQANSSPQAVLSLLR